MSYSADFALCYDRLMQDADYESRSRRIYELMVQMLPGKPDLLLDLCCGTGAMSRLLADSGISVIGVDRSSDMLAVAQQHSEGRDILYLCQPAEELDLYGTVDAAICTMDSLNHITDPAALEQVLARLALFIRPGGLFVFDVNTQYKHRFVLGNRCFVQETDDVFCVWQNNTDPETCVTEMTLDFFSRSGDAWRRTGERFCERAYDTEDLRKILQNNHFELCGEYDDLSDRPPCETSERILFVVRRTQEN